MTQVFPNCLGPETEAEEAPLFISTHGVTGSGLAQTPWPPGPRSPLPQHPAHSAPWVAAGTVHCGKATPLQTGKAASPVVFLESTEEGASGP